jgi:hypothetical protein
VVPTRDAENRGKGFIALQLEVDDPSRAQPASLVIINIAGGRGEAFAVKARALITQVIPEAANVLTLNAGGKKMRLSK